MSSYEITCITGLTPASNLMREIGRRIRDERLKAGLTARELAFFSGVTFQLICELEWGRRKNIDVLTLLLIREALRCHKSG